MLGLHDVTQEGIDRSVMPCGNPVQATKPADCLQDTSTLENKILLQSKRSEDVKGEQSNTSHVQNSAKLDKT